MHNPADQLNLSSQESANGTADRLAEPVDTEQPPRLPFPVIGIGASAGGLEAFIEFFDAMRPDTGMAFVLIQHLPPDRDSLMVEILAKHTAMPVREVEDGMKVEANVVYLIRPGRTLTLHEGTLHLGEPLQKRGHRHPVDDFFRSLAEEQRERAVCIIMSGMGSNGTAGAQAIKAVGGVCIAQEPAGAKFSSMPQHLLESGLADFVLKPAEMPEVLERYSKHPYATGASLSRATAGTDRDVLGEILTGLRARTRHDFSGYKRPTLLRRIERRMGLHQTLSIADYARFLRQSPAETTALADDLVIHVTGFFRDAGAWEALRTRVIEPLVASRASSSIRAWVTACSSGEEAYTLAILLAEAASRANRDLDIKIFATDTAERSLSQARSGLYPAGIESEVASSRLDRFFDKVGSMYRVKQQLREVVVFAPQNILQDPPFSRLDIVTCRNLLIYLEPDTQRRALELAHFGLREGGTLMLGNSETVPGDSELFEVVDHQHRLYRRVGPTRHGAVQFPLLATTQSPESDAAHRPRLRTSVGAMANRMLLERYTPPAVVIDRNHRILFFHGVTDSYLDLPRGEPTHDLLTLARESIRGTLRTAVQQAITYHDAVRVADRWSMLPNGRRRRTVICVAPVDPRDKEAGFLVTFDEEFEAEAAVAGTAVQIEDHRQLAVELQRVRDELQSTIQELHNRNEEMRASHEEATSMNEELQSTNEELETSKEELQSLNEELVTVNSQLQLKMDELEATSNDLSSLLSSTSIAVVFLDTGFRIRRFTPAVRQLMELIPADVGRPLSDLARKFHDDELLADARTVLESLTPIEKEVETHTGRIYVRRALPYRTIDNRIEGVVITFIDITERSHAVAALRESEEQYRLILEGLNEYGIFMLDSTGHVMTWPSGAERLLQYTPAEALGKHLAEFLPATGNSAAQALEDLENASTQGSVTQEGWHVRRDGGQFWGNGMLAAIKDTHGTVAGFVKVLRDNTDRKLNEEALTQAKRAAEAANESKDRFLANVSHELRTPLSAILLWTSLIQDKEHVAPDQLVQALAAINRSAEEQRELVEDLVDTSRIAAGKFVLDIRQAHLPSIVQAGIDAVTRAAQEKNVAIALDIDVATDTVRADARRLHQVVANLVGNAVKFTRRGGTVQVTLEREGPDVVLTVADSGIGIAPEFLPHVFERFAQVRSSGTRVKGGLGLGLAIVKQIVELHGGSVSAESPGVGRGAVFTVRMPLPAADHLAEAPQSSQKRPIAGRLAGTHVLVLEDVLETRVALDAVLQEAGAEVVAVDSALAAYDAFRAHRPDIIVSDLGLPDIDGYEFMAQIRSLERSLQQAPVPAVALTAYAGGTVRRRALDSGFNNCLTKPIQPLVLVQALAELGRVAGRGANEDDRPASADTTSL